MYRRTHVDNLATAASEKLKSVKKLPLFQMCMFIQPPFLHIPFVNISGNNGYPVAM